MVFVTVFFTIETILNKFCGNFSVVKLVRKKFAIRNLPCAMRTAGILILILIWSPIFRSSITSLSSENIYLDCSVSGDSSLVHFTHAAGGPAAYRLTPKPFLITLCLSQILHQVSDGKLCLRSSSKFLHLEILKIR